MLSAQPNYDPKENLVLYLINHPEIKPYWGKYINHEFVKQIVAGKLPLENFNYYNDQNSYYLQKYLYVQQELLKLTDNETLLEYIQMVIDVVLAEQREETDVQRHDDIKKQTKSPVNQACKDYTAYLVSSIDNPVGGKPNVFRTFLHLSTCLFGYNCACANLYNPARRYDLVTRSLVDQTEVSKDLVVPSIDNATYRNWVEYYLNDDSIKTLRQGQECLQLAFKLDHGEVKLDEIVKIFKQGVLLEIRFWDACLSMK
ncbi:unnamed protein product [Ambrosiozyma monospora]|uniref:Unnamed protein product n=1 Tax=Ambrosiozyma monospora TaxID=43982 RepID=A0A9W6YZC9_AMBMO|nr:unnamed protein product [Ambrosiozyma monospora]